MPNQVKKTPRCTILLVHVYANNPEILTIFADDNLPEEEAKARRD